MDSSRSREYEEDEEEEASIIEEDYKEDDEDFKQLDELIPPKVTCWTGANGRIIHGIVVINDDLYDTKITCQMDACPICFHAWTTHGKHRMCCLPCGHMYGLSCINKWLLQNSSCGKCPQCNTLCSYKDIILLYATRLSGQDKARYFPFTKLAYQLFMVNEQRRQCDARKLIPLTTARVVHILQEMQAVGDQCTNSMAQWNDVKKQLQELELLVENFGKPVDDTLGEVDALKRQADALKVETTD